MGAFFIFDRTLHKVKSGHFCFGEVLLDHDFRLATDVVQHIIYHGNPSLEGKLLSIFASARLLKNSRQDLKKIFI